jgi:membrane fusion protein (multidrug efflux system)
MHSSYSELTTSWINWLFRSVLLATLLGGCGDASSPSGAAANQAPEVDIFPVQARPVMLTTELPGRATPYRIAEVRPQVGGIIQERLFKEGGVIHAGQVLYQIDPAVYQALYDNAQALLSRALATRDRAQLKAQRYDNLAKAKAVSREDDDDAEAALKEALAGVAVAEADLAHAKINLDYTRLTSPIAGRIGRSMVTQGALVTANQELALATVQQLDPIYIDLTQSSADLLRLRQALKDGRIERPQNQAPTVRLILEDGSLYPLPGQLEFSEVTVDQQSGAITLRALVPNPDHLILPGMFVRARVEEGLIQEAILVPQRGVTHNRRGEPIAFVVNDQQQIEQRTLQTNRTLGSDWLIDDGLQTGDRLVVAGLQFIRPGVSVRIAGEE